MVKCSRCVCEVLSSSFSFSNFCYFGISHISFQWAYIKLPIIPCQNEPAGSSGKGVSVLEVLSSNIGVSVGICFCSIL